MHRVVVTGFGIVSSIGNNKSEVVESLHHGRSGITFSQEYADLGFRSHVHGDVDIDLDANIDRKLKRFMGDSAAYNYIATEEAIQHAGLTEEQVSHLRTGLIMGSGGGSPETSLQQQIFSGTKALEGLGPTGSPGRCRAPMRHVSLQLLK